MQITHVSINNFRCIEHLDFHARAMSILIGENNAGKSSVIDAVRIALSRRWGRSGRTGFSEFDFRKVSDAGQVRYLDIEIVLKFAERISGEWSEDLIGALNDIIVTEPTSDLNYITMRVRCSFENVTKSVEPEWQFLNEAGEPFAGRGGRNQNLSSFFEYVPSFSMSAQRDASSEFGGRSQLWGGLLKTISIDEATTTRLESEFADLNRQLLTADPKVDAIKGTLLNISSVIAKGAAGAVDLRAVPADLWDIISKTQLVIQGAATDPWLPISCHGHGVQSLAIIFLFRAFVENALSAGAEAEGEPILMLEEPEAHLHPQASRSLWEAISGFPGQKLITTHSPYFLQNVPLTELVVLRRGEAGTAAAVVPRSYQIEVPVNGPLQGVVGSSAGRMALEGNPSALVFRGVMSQDEYRELLKCYTGADRNDIHAKIKALREQTENYLSDEEVSKLESWAKRIRGEIFFAKKWLLCEGQSDYALLGAVAEVIGCPADASGIALIDYQNNGSPGAFAALARSLGYPWAMICDGDTGGDDHKSQLKARNFSQALIDNHVTQLPAGVDLEALVVASDLRHLLRDAVWELDAAVPDSDEKLIEFARSRKEETAVRVARRIRSFVGPIRIPPELRAPFVTLGECSP